MNNNNLDIFIKDLLNINKVKDNKLIDLYGKAPQNSLFLRIPGAGNQGIAAYALEVINNRYGKEGNTVLLKSSLNDRENVIGSSVNAFDWADGNGELDAMALRNHIEKIYKEFTLKGNNPSFISIGALNWEASIPNNPDTIKVKSPFLIFPIRLKRTDASNTPVSIEFLSEDIYINPCLLAKLSDDLSKDIVNNLPLPGISDPEEAIPLENITVKYLEQVKTYIANERKPGFSEDIVFDFEVDCVAISEYNHSDICMYYDIKRNRELIDKSPLVDKIFYKNSHPEFGVNITKQPRPIYSYDTVQYRIMSRILNGESLVIKGPPGSGKTHTITNIISSLLAENKKVLLTSVKNAALFEVYAKLPDELRKFAMLLNSETEAQAAKLNPIDIKKDLNGLLNERSKYNNPDNAYEDYIRAAQKLSQIRLDLDKYQSHLYEKSSRFFGQSFYDACDIYSNIDCEPICFDKPDTVVTVNKENFLRLNDKVKLLDGYFNEITKYGTFEYNPWLSINHKYNIKSFDDAYKDGLKIKDIIDDTISKYKESGLDKNLTLKELYLLTSKNLKEFDFSIISSPRTKSIVDRLKTAIDYYIIVNTDGINTIEVTKSERVKKCYEALRCHNINILRLPVSLFNDIVKYKSVIETFKNESKHSNVIIELSNIKIANTKLVDFNDSIYSIIRKDLSDKEMQIFIKAYDKIKDYDIDDHKPKFLDFTTKSNYEKVVGCGYGDKISFDEFKKVVNTLHEIDVTKEEIKGYEVEISKILQTKLTDEILNIIKSFFSFTNNAGYDVCTFFEKFDSFYQPVLESFDDIKNEEKYNLFELIQAIAKFYAMDDIVSIAREIDDTISYEKAYDFAEEIVVLTRLFNKKTLGETEEELKNNSIEFYNKGYEVKLCLDKLYKGFDEFNKNHYTNNYSKFNYSITINDLSFYSNMIIDRALIDSTYSYENEIYNTENGIKLNEFFKAFEKDLSLCKTYSISSQFEHSMYYLALQDYFASLGVARNGVTKNVYRMLKEFYEADSAQRQAAVKVIESLCMGRINPTDPAFSFLKAERGIGGTLRKLVNDNAEAIFKLKKCFIISPSTISVLFKDKAFNEFDIAIVDEASQLEPTQILPILFRCKQIVLVGDLWQMPPISHFEATTKKVIVDDKGDEITLDNNTSVLSLALDNQAFDTEELTCHYRSKTESLIKFSQEKFYPFMKTFPAACPKAEGLGLFDIYMPEAYQEGGVNKEEAVRAVAEFKKYMNMYFDKQTKVLKESIGVVVFGIKQLEYVNNLVKQDKELMNMIADAYSTFDDLPEKLIFFKTIETVQGQEIDNLIISLTYGRNSKGEIVQRFGELNLGSNDNKIGVCIFNVAVTRAKTSVTLIHSIRSVDITNPSIQFISEYIECVERFGQDDSVQFVGQSVDETKGFVNQFCNYLVSLGINKERIVANYGATEGSIKIPVVVLSENLKDALVGFWLDTEFNNEHDYVDYNLKYYSSLQLRDWKLERIFIQDWIDNRESCEKQVKEIINNIK